MSIERLRKRQEASGSVWPDERDTCPAVPVLIENALDDARGSLCDAVATEGRPPHHPGEIRRLGYACYPRSSGEGCDGDNPPRKQQRLLKVNQLLPRTKSEDPGHSEVIDEMCSRTLRIGGVVA